MSANTLEWTEPTGNPVTGCTQVSPAGNHGYAERMALRLQAMGAPGYARGFALTFTRTASARRANARNRGSMSSA